MRNEVLNGEEFDSALEARVVIADWLATYNTSGRTAGSAC